MPQNNIDQVSVQVLDLKDLISAPLLATIDADAISTRRFLNYFYELAFEYYDPITHKAGPLRMLEFSYSSVEASAIQQNTIRVPLLSLVPLPLLQVHEADFDFDIQVVDALQPDPDQRRHLPGFRENPAAKLVSIPDEAIRLRASMAPVQDRSVAISHQSSLSANMKISVKMRQADMPGGLSKLLQLSANDVVSQQQNKQE